MQLDGLRIWAAALLSLAALAYGCGRSDLMSDEESSYFTAGDTSLGGNGGSSGFISWGANAGRSGYTSLGGNAGHSGYTSLGGNAGSSGMTAVGGTVWNATGGSSRGGSVSWLGGASGTGGGVFPFGGGGPGGTSGAGGSVSPAGASGWSGYTAAGGVWGGGAGSGGIANGGNGVGAAAGASSAGGAALQLSLIDDMEDGDSDILPVEGRRGYWYTFNDASPGGEQLPVSNGLLFEMTAISNRPNSSFAAATWGEGFVLWGAGMGLILNDRFAARQFYNARRYLGIAFWARVEVGSSNVLRFNVSDRNTVPEGGVCVECWDHFGATIVVDSSWRQYRFSWDQLRQRGWGSPLLDAIDTTALRSVEFDVPEGVSFWLYIDDVAFFY